MRDLHGALSRVRSGGHFKHSKAQGNRPITWPYSEGPFLEGNSPSAKFARACGSYDTRDTNMVDSSHTSFVPCGHGLVKAVESYDEATHALAELNPTL